MVPDRRPPIELADERTTLVAYLDYLRESIVLKLEGVDDDDARRPLVPSGTSLQRLVDHLIDVDQYWFHLVLAGEPDIDFVGDTPSPSPAAAVARYRAVTARSNELVERCSDMEQPSAKETFDGRRPTLRWILVHMVEETGRHAGHADIIRELIDGAVGR